MVLQTNLAVNAQTELIKQHKQTLQNSCMRVHSSIDSELSTYWAILSVVKLMNNESKSTSTWAVHEGRALPSKSSGPQIISEEQQSLSFLHCDRGRAEI